MQIAYVAILIAYYVHPCLGCLTAEKQGSIVASTINAMEATTSYENKPLGKLTELFSSPKRIRNGSSCPSTPSKTRNFLKRIGRSVSETSAGKESEASDSSQWVKDTKNAIAEASSVQELKQHLYTLLDKVNMIETELKFVQTERQMLQKELETVKKQRTFPFKSLHGFLSRSSSQTSSNETSPTRKRQEAYVYLGARGHRRRSSSEIIVSPRVSSIAEESTKPRRKSTAGILKFDRIKSMEKGALTESTIALEETCLMSPDRRDMQERSTFSFTDDAEPLWQVFSHMSLVTVKLSCIKAVVLFKFVSCSRFCIEV